VSSLVGLPEGLVQVYEIDINNAGQVSVMAIPEPQSYMMLLGGVGSDRVHCASEAPAGLGTLTTLPYPIAASGPVSAPWIDARRKCALIQPCGEVLLIRPEPSRASPVDLLYLLPCQGAYRAPEEAQICPYSWCHAVQCLGSVAGARAREPW
jgi:hypothetical protein